MLKSAGIDIDWYTAHNIAEQPQHPFARLKADKYKVMKEAGWTNAKTSARFHGKPFEGSNENFTSFFRRGVSNL